nr:PipX family protein [Pseudanabaena galeata]
MLFTIQKKFTSPSSSNLLNFLACQMSEHYLNHPTFGLLSRLCRVDEFRSLFTTLYAQRLFFLITTGPDGVQFEPVSRADAKLMVENQMRSLRRGGTDTDQKNLQHIYKRTFSQ